MSESDILVITGISLGAICGTLANNKYNDCNKEEKEEWKENRICHHGALGCGMVVGGIVLTLFSKKIVVLIIAILLICVGIGLILTDLHDIDKWFTEGLLFN